MMAVPNMTIATAASSRLLNHRSFGFLRMIWNVRMQSRAKSKFSFSSAPLQGPEPLDCNDRPALG